MVNDRFLVLDVPRFFQEYALQWRGAVDAENENKINGRSRSIERHTSAATEQWLLTAARTASQWWAKLNTKYNLLTNSLINLFQLEQCFNKKVWLKH